MLILLLPWIPNSCTETWQNQVFTLAYQWQSLLCPKQTEIYAEPWSSWKTHRHQCVLCQAKKIFKCQFLLAIKSPAACTSVLVVWLNLMCNNLHLDLRERKLLSSDSRLQGVSTAVTVLSAHRDVQEHSLWREFSTLIIIFDSSLSLCSIYSCVTESVCMCVFLLCSLAATIVWAMHPCGQYTPQSK